MGLSTKAAITGLCVILLASQAICGRKSKSKTLEAYDQDRGGERSGRLFPLFAFVRFSQTVCRTDSGDTGVCVKKSTCSSMGGTEMGKCAQNYGTCCMITKKCSADPVTVSTNGTKLVPDGTFHELCRYEIPKQPGVCQVRLDFEKFQIQTSGERTEFFGECNTDTLTISGNANGNQLGALCGNLDGQHMYLDYGSNDRINLDIFMMNQANQNWNILVTMIKCDSTERAPQGCLQYFQAQRAMVRSFNYNMGAGQQLNNQDYSVCVKANPGMKKITWKSCGNLRDFTITGNTDPANFPIIEPPELGSETGDMCKADWVMIYGIDKYCGSWFPNDGVSSMTQPFMMQVHFNEREIIIPPPAECNAVDSCDIKNSGFCLMYSQTP